MVSLLNVGQAVQNLGCNGGPVGVIFDSITGRGGCASRGATRAGLVPGWATVRELAVRRTLGRFASTNPNRQILGRHKLGAVGQLARAQQMITIFPAGGAGVLWTLYVLPWRILLQAEVL